MAKKTYTPLTETEKVIIYDFLERIQEDPLFREAVNNHPEIVLATSSPNTSYSNLLRENILEVLSGLRRVALEEIGIDVSSYRNVVKDNGFKMRADVKKKK